MFLVKTEGAHRLSHKVFDKQLDQLSSQTLKHSQTHFALPWKCFVCVIVIVEDSYLCVCCRGFCFFNSVAIAAKQLREKCKLNKILIIDWVSVFL